MIKTNDISNVRIRLANMDDVGQICLLYNEFYLYNAKLQPEYYCAIKETGSYPTSVIEKSDGDIVIAVENETLIGLVHIEENHTLPFDPIVPHKYAEVIDLIVTESYRNKGVAAQLMEAAKQWSRKRKLEYIELFVLSEATEAKQFYERQGLINASSTLRFKL